MPDCYYPIPEGWRAQSQAGWAWGRSWNWRRHLISQLISDSSTREASPAPTLIGRCCHDVFKFRISPHKHTSTHTPPGINLPGWERGRSVSLPTFLIPGGRGRQASWLDAGGFSSQGPVGREAPLFPAQSAGWKARVLGCSIHGAHQQG